MCRYLLSFVGGLVFGFTGYIFGSRVVDFYGDVDLDKVGFVFRTLGDEVRR